MTMSKDKILTQLLALAETFNGLSDGSVEALPQDLQAPFTAALQHAQVQNPWFTQREIQRCFGAWAKALNEKDLATFIKDCPNADGQTVAIIAAGNIPLVSFHDILTVLLCGANLKIKLSSDDKVLSKAVIELLQSMVPDFSGRVEIVERVSPKLVHGLIATGSNNTARYFEYYFRELPKVLRKNRTSVAVLSGNESREDLQALATDVYAYFGLGCRNVAKVYIPQDFDIQRYFEVLPEFDYLQDHNKYMNNYTYHKALLLLDQKGFLENGFAIVKESVDLHSPISTLYVERYQNPEEVDAKIAGLGDQIQCRVGLGGLPFGQAQQPSLLDFADGVDTRKFISEMRQ